MTCESYDNFQFTFATTDLFFSGTCAVVPTSSGMQSAVDGFGSGSISAARATAAGATGSIVYTMLGIALFLTISGIIVFVVRRFGERNTSFKK